MEKEDNWWIAGEEGPCGPDTEMFYDTGKSHVAQTVTLPAVVVNMWKSGTMFLWNTTKMQTVTAN